MPQTPTKENPPFGYTLTSAGDLRPAPAEQKIVAAARTLAKQRHLSLRKIADMLKARGMLSRAGTPFQASQIARMLKRPVRVWPHIKPGPCPRCGNTFQPRNPWHRFCCSLKGHHAIWSAQRKPSRRGLPSERVAPLDIFKRDNWTCQVCGAPTPQKKLGSLVSDAPTMNHIVPIAQGGEHTAVNLRCACRSCASKSGRRRRIAVA